METKFRKLGLLVGVVCTCCCLFAQAANSSEAPCPQKCPEPCPSQPQGTYCRGTYREITPNAGPRVCYGADVFITADFIWWKAVQEGTTYASTGVGASSSTTDVQKGKQKRVGQDWSPGFKVGLGLNLGHDGWDLFTQYTWLHPSNRSSLSATSTDGSSNTDVEGVPSEQVDLAKSRWSLHFNVIDLELGRNFYLSQFLTMRPFIGFKGTWQEQDTVTRYTRDNGFTEFGASTGPYRTRNHLDIWGIGIRSGFNLSWYLANNWSIFGRLAWTAMWTDYDENSRKDRVTDTTDLTTLIVVNVDDDGGQDHYAVKQIGEFEVGLRWEIWFSDDNYHFAIQAGWEEQIWINWAGNVSINPDRGFRDLSFHGLTAKLRFDF